MSIGGPPVSLPGGEGEGLCPLFDILVLPSSSMYRYVLVCKRQQAWFGPDLLSAFFESSPTCHGAVVDRISREPHSGAGSSGNTCTNPVGLPSQQFASVAI